MNKIITLFTAACLLVSAANAQQEKKVVIVKTMDTTIIHEKESGPQKMTVIVENGKITINGKPVDGVNLPEMMGGGAGIPKLTELKIAKGMPLDMSQLGETFALAFNEGPKIGISIEDLTEGAGAKVLEVTEGSPAAKAGIVKNDIITSVDGSSICDVATLQEKASDLKAGDAITLKLTRDGKTKEVTVKIPKKVKKANI
jgi:serine protease Do